MGRQIVLWCYHAADRLLGTTDYLSRDDSDQLALILSLIPTGHDEFDGKSVSKKNICYSTFVSLLPPNKHTEFHTNKHFANLDRRSCAIVRAVARKNRRKSCHNTGYTFMPWHTIQNILRIAKRNFFAYVKVKTIQSFRSHLQGPRSILTLEERTVTLSQNMGNKYLVYTDAAQYPPRANSSTYFYLH